jgi:protease II
MSTSGSNPSSISSPQDSFLSLSDLSQNPMEENVRIQIPQQTPDLFEMLHAIQEQIRWIQDNQMTVYQVLNVNRLVEAVAALTAAQPPSRVMVMPEIEQYLANSIDNAQKEEHFLIQLNGT